MKSKANIKGHSIHPMLVPFPIAFFTGTFILDTLWQFTNRESFGQAAIYAQSGGIIFSLLAAIPGLIDYVYTVPPKSTAGKRGLKHGILNGSMFLIFILALILKLTSEISLFYILGLEAIGVIILTISGWLGGTLTSRNQIGTDHRYADAGKWIEKKINTTSEKIEITDHDKLKVNQMMLLHVNEKRIVIARTEEELVAFEDHCSHRGGSLADGVLICGTVQCPWHGSQFDVKNGSVKAGPAKESIKTYELVNESGKIFLRI